MYLKRPTAKPGLTPKLHPKYKGPYLLTCILGKNGLIGPTTPGRGKTMWVHLDHLKRAYTRKMNTFDWEQENSAEGDVMNGAYGEEVQETAEPDDDPDLGEEELGAQQQPLLDADDQTVMWDEAEEELPDVPTHGYNLRRRY